MSYIVRQRRRGHEDGQATGYEIRRDIAQSAIFRVVVTKQNCNSPDIENIHIETGLSPMREGPATEIGYSNQLV